MAHIIIVGGHSNTRVEKFALWDETGHWGTRFTVDRLKL